MFVEIAARYTGDSWGRHLWFDGFLRKCYSRVLITSMQLFFKTVTVGDVVDSSEWFLIVL